MPFAALWKTRDGHVTIASASISISAAASISLVTSTIVVAGRMSLKTFAVDAGDCFPLADVGDVHPCADDVLELAAEGFDGGLDDGERAGGLGGEVGCVGAVGVDADGAGDGDRVAAADGAAVAHERLPLGAAGSTAPAGAIVDGDVDVGHFWGLGAGDLGLNINGFERKEKLIGWGRGGKRV